LFTNDFLFERIAFYFNLLSGEISLGEFLHSAFKSVICSYEVPHMYCECRLRSRCSLTICH